jgi:hypothetical protein
MKTAATNHKNPYTFVKLEIACGMHFAARHFTKSGTLSNEY